MIYNKTCLRWAITGYWPDPGWVILGWGYFGRDPAAENVRTAMWRTRREAREARKRLSCHVKYRVIQVRVTVEAVQP